MSPVDPSGSSYRKSRVRVRVREGKVAMGERREERDPKVLRCWL